MEPRDFSDLTRWKPFLEPLIFLVSLSLNLGMWPKVPSWKPFLLLHSPAPLQYVWNLFSCIIVLTSQAHHGSPFTLRRGQDVSVTEERKGGDLPRLNHIPMALSPQGRWIPACLRRHEVWIRVIGVPRAPQVILIYNFFFSPYLFPDH